MEFKEFMEEFKETTGDIKELIDKQKEEIKENGTATEETNKALEELKEQYTELEAKIQRGDFSTGEEKEAKSLGEIFTKSDEYKTMIDSGNDSSGIVKVKSFFEKKDLSSSLDSAGHLVQPQQAPMIVPPMQELRIRDLLGQATTSSNSVEYIRETGFDNQAGTFGEFNSTDGDEKPKSDITFDKDSASVKNIGHWLPTTRQIIADASQLQGHVNTRLIYGLKLVEEEQILYGDGLGDNLEGIVPLATEFDEDRRGENDTKIDLLRRAITQATLAGYPVSGIVLHPNDWEDIELMKGINGHYIWVSVQEGGTSKLWKVPVVSTVAIEDGTFLLGAFQMGATLWDREQASIRVSDSHANFFTKNMLAILAEERLALTVYRPEAFVHGAFEAPIGG